VDSLIPASTRPN